MACFVGVVPLHPHPRQRSPGLLSSSRPAGTAGRRSQAERARIVVAHCADIDVSYFPKEPSRDAVDVEAPLEEYTQLREYLAGVPVYLVGMMGSGKSTVGQILAQNLRYTFFDTDELIQTVMKMPITKIFDTHGEEGFRQVESAVLQQVSAYVRSIISTGGGIVLDPENWGSLQTGLVVWLDTPVRLILERLQGDTSRPLLQVDDPEARLTSILDERRRLYQQADVRVVVEEGEGEEEVAFNVARGLIRFIQMNPSKSVVRRELES